MKSLEEIIVELKKLNLDLRPYREEEDEEQLYEIFCEVVKAGNQFSYESDSKQEFDKQFIKPNNHLFVCCDNQKVIAGFYIKSNYEGRSDHIANSAYMIASGYRGKGLGTLLVQASLHMAKHLGFRAMQFNNVLSQNQVAIKLYEKLGFRIIGSIPSQLKNGSSQDGYIMYREIV